MSVIIAGWVKEKRVAVVEQVLGGMLEAIAAHVGFGHAIGTDGRPPWHRR